MLGIAGDDSDKGCHHAQHLILRRHNLYEQTRIEKRYKASSQALFTNLFLGNFWRWLIKKRRLPWKRGPAGGLLSGGGPVLYKPPDLDSAQGQPLEGHGPHRSILPLVSQAGTLIRQAALQCNAALLIVENVINDGPLLEDFICVFRSWIIAGGQTRDGTGQLLRLAGCPATKLLSGILGGKDHVGHIFRVHNKNSFQATKNGHNYSVTITMPRSNSKGFSVPTLPHRSPIVNPYIANFSVNSIGL